MITITDNIISRWTSIMPTPVSALEKEIKFGKMYTSMVGFLQGAGMFEALRALELGKSLHIGYRKDGVTPEFQHQLDIAHHIIDLKGVMNLEKVLIAVFLHDADEDYPHKIPTGELLTFGEDSQATIRRLNKHTCDSESQYYNDLANDPDGSLAKGGDRVNNFQTMITGGFKFEKMLTYCFDVKFKFLPMLKKARKNFPKQFHAYRAIEMKLRDQLELITQYLIANHGAEMSIALQEKAPE